jgi:uracil-DNA glycosylase
MRCMAFFLLFGKPAPAYIVISIMATSLKQLLADIRACALCAEHLPHGPRPVLQIHSSARILIAAQAPGRKVHDTGVPFNDASGKRLRAWLGMSEQSFYDPSVVAILPMGFCYPGKAQSGDLPPRIECAPAWRPSVLSHLKHVKLTLVIGQYALAYHLPGSGSVTDTVRNWREHWPRIVPLPHPSPRNNVWFRRNPWFEQAVVPALQALVAEILSAPKK